MSSTLLLSIVFIYFLLLLGVAWYTSKNSNNDSFFIGNKNSNWLLVAFGMIGTSLSGVTFVSVPGTVSGAGFGYFQVVIGYLFGYMVIAFVLLPLYYKLEVTSIYKYLQERFGNTSYKTGALFFIISRMLGATARLFLVINVLHLFILKDLGVPFFISTFVILLMILLYTFEGGVKTIVFTDTLQTTFMILGLLICIVFLMKNLGTNSSAVMAELKSANLTRIFNTDINSSGFWLKNIMGGMFIAITMTGLDQEMMQKNISVSTLKNSQKNIFTFSIILLIVNFLFLFMGGLLYLFATKNNIQVPADDLFPTIALNYMPGITSIIFIIGLISALFPSADGALTALTSSFCIDILGFQRKKGLTEKAKRTTRLTVHLLFAIAFLIMVMIFRWIDNKSIIDVILKVAGFTYGPLLGLFAFGILTERKVDDSKVLFVCLLAPLIILGIDFINNVDWYQRQLKFSIESLAGIKSVSNSIFGSFRIGYELLIYNGLVTFLGLWLISSRGTSKLGNS
ncbi:MAG: sodium:solute symporter [Saprospiraceae bacterium]